MSATPLRAKMCCHGPSQQARFDVAIGDQIFFNNERGELKAGTLQGLLGTDQVLVSVASGIKQTQISVLASNIVAVLLPD